MRPVPWQRHISYWRCIACGECCKHYTVNIDFADYVRITKTYGPEVAGPGLTGCYLKKRPDGRCVFQYYMAGSHWLCGLQHMKPKVCRLWPFKVLSEPTYGREKDARYSFNDRTYYVYVDPYCRGIIWGDLSLEFIDATVPEFIQLAIGRTEKQTRSTSSLSFAQPILLRI